MEKLRKFISADEGVTAMEYALIAAITVIVLALLMFTMRDALSSIWQSVTDALVAGAS